MKRRISILDVIISAFVLAVPILARPTDPIPGLAILGAAATIGSLVAATHWLLEARARRLLPARIAELEAKAAATEPPSIASVAGYRVPDRAHEAEQALAERYAADVARDRERDQARGKRYLLLASLGLALGVLPVAFGAGTTTLLSFAVVPLLLVSGVLAWLARREERAPVRVATEAPHLRVDAAPEASRASDEPLSEGAETAETPETEETAEIAEAKPAATRALRS